MPTRPGLTPKAWVVGACWDQWDELPMASYGVCEVMSACIMWCCEAVRTQVTASLFGCTCSDRSTNDPVGYSVSPLLSIRNITLFGQWPAPLGNGLLG